MPSEGFFFTFFPPQFCQKVYVTQKICKTIPLALWGRRQGPTAVAHGGRVCNFFCLNSDGGKLYTKL
jgi:hypothetical protein